MKRRTAILPFSRPSFSEVAQLSPAFFGEVVP
jgi:hypothetical protein